MTNKVFSISSLKSSTNFMNLFGHLIYQIGPGLTTEHQVCVSDSVAPTDEELKGSVVFALISLVLIPFLMPRPALAA